MVTCSIAILNGFRMEVEGRVVEIDAWRSRRGADVVKLLALTPDHQLHREQVMHALWPDLAPDAAAANLRKAIHYARRALGSEDSIVTDDGLIRLWPAAQLEIDADRFGAAAESATADGSRQAFERALALYVGDALPADRYEPWVEPWRERLHSRYLELLRRAERWELVSELDPTDEPAARALMRRAIEADNRSAAIHVFDRLRQALREELGISPSAETAKVYETILAMDETEPLSLAERVRSLLARSLVNLSRRELEEAERTAQAARALALDAGLTRELGETSTLLSLIAHERGTWWEVFREEFDGSLRQAREMATSCYDGLLCFIQFYLDGPEGLSETRALSTEMLAIARGAQSVEGEALAVLMLGEVELMSGRLDRAVAKLGHAAALTERTGWNAGRALSLQRLAEAMLARGQRDVAMQTATEAIRLAARSDIRQHLVVRCLGTILESSDGASAGLAALVDAEAVLETSPPCEPCSIGFRTSAVRASTAAGDLDRARRHAREVERISGLWQGGPWAAAVWEVRGRLRLAEGEAERGTALLREAADGFARSGRPADEARCLAAATEASTGSSADR